MEKKIVVPEEMLRAAREAGIENDGFSANNLPVCLEAALRWRSEMMEQDVYKVYRDTDKEPVLTTQTLSRAIEALDSMFDNYDSDYGKPDTARIELNGNVIETRRQDKQMRLQRDPPAEVHHHAAPYTPRLFNQPKRDPRKILFQTKTI
jgi:hypothetical protein